MVGTPRPNCISDLHVGVGAGWVVVYPLRVGDLGGQGSVRTYQRESVKGGLGGIGMEPSALGRGLLFRPARSLVGVRHGVHSSTGHAGALQARRRAGACSSWSTVMTGPS